MRKYIFQIKFGTPPTIFSLSQFTNNNFRFESTNTFEFLKIHLIQALSDLRIQRITKKNENNRNLKLLKKQRDREMYCKF